MKTWISVLIIGIIIGFVGMVMEQDRTFVVIGFYGKIIGLVMIAGAIITAVMRLWGRMLSD